jgi:hypothetical protein
LGKRRKANFEKATRDGIHFWSICGRIGLCQGIQGRVQQTDLRWFDCAQLMFKEITGGQG